MDSLKEIEILLICRMDDGLFYLWKGILVVGKPLFGWCMWWSSEKAL